jgi:ELWxxDGT repeat protein
VDQLGDRLLIAGGRDGAAFEGDFYRELLVSDGTSEGTKVLVECSTPCIPVASPTPGVRFGRGLFYRVDEQHGLEPWQTDGTFEGTRPIADTCPGPCDGIAGLFDIVRGTYLFRGSDSQAQASNAKLLWSEGVGQPTSFTAFELENPFGSILAYATLRRRLVFAADDGIHGRELWVSEIAPPPPSCVAGPTTLCLGENRFRLEVTWSDFAGSSGSGNAQSLTADTGTFWFFDPANVELIVKVLDATSINGFHWVFYGALSNVEYELTVTDTVTGESKTYRNPSGVFASAGDVEALPDDPAVLPDTSGRVESEWRESRERGLVARPNGAPQRGALLPLAAFPAFASETTEAASLGADCVESLTRLCLAGGRFAVEVGWADFEGGSGQGKTISLTSDTGAFWFFDESNIELVLKVLDARSVNGKFWVFYGALSNVEYTITVTDTATGAVKTYSNPAGQFASAGDTEAF